MGALTPFSHPSRDADLARTAATYFTRFGSTDRLAFKLLVGFLTVSALADTMVDCAWAWLYTVKSFTDSNVLALFPWTFVAYAVLTGPNVLLTQGFFTYVSLSLLVIPSLTLSSLSWRVWIVSNRKNWWLPAIMLVLQLTACAMCWYLAHWINQATYMTEFGEVKVRPTLPSDRSSLTLPFCAVAALHLVIVGFCL